MVDSQPQSEKLLIKALIKAKDPRGFLEAAFSALKKTNPKFNYTTFAKKAGFSSRSHPREVVCGNRRVTLGSLPRFVKGLGLDGDAAECFKLLVFTENKVDLHSSKTKLKVVKDRLRQAVSEGKKDFSGYEYQSWPAIFASLGGADGARISQIKRRTKLPALELKNHLAKMRRKGLINFDEKCETYKVCERHLIMTKLGDSEIFKSFFLASLDKARHLAARSFKSKKNLFFNSTVSVNTKKLPKLRAELEQLLIKYIDQIEDPEGETIASISVSLFDPSN